MSLYIKYRPSELAQIKGNQDIVATLDGLLADRSKSPHTFLLHGPTGCGKTTIARIIADKLGCKGADLKEVDAGQFRGIDTTRDIRNQSQYMAIEGDCRVWILDECHKMTNDAQNGLLKILEDPPDHVYFILCTTDPQKLLPTIKGRCSQFQVKPLSDKQMYSLLRKVARSEGEQLDENIYEIIIRDSMCHPRNALQILEQVLKVSPERRAEVAQQTAAQQSQAIELCRALINRAPWKSVAVILTGLKDQEAEGIRRCVLGYCQNTLLSGKDLPICGLILEEFINPFYDSGFPQLVYACYSVTKN